MGRRNEQATSAEVFPRAQIQRAARGALRAADFGPDSVLPVPIAEIADAAGLHRDSLYDIGAAEEVPPALRSILKKLPNLVLGALSIPERRIFIDRSMPAERSRFTEAHEIGHDAIPWHRDAYYGDTSETLDHRTESALEIEANFFAAELIFGLERFNNEADEYRPSIDVPLGLNSTYGASAHATIRRYVEGSRRELGLIVAGRLPGHSADLSVPIFSAHQSAAFEQRFGALHPMVGRRLRASAYESLPELIVDHVVHAAESSIVLDTQRGRMRFKAEGFCNGRINLILLSRRKISAGRAVKLVNASGRPFS